MQPFETLTSRAVPLLVDDVDTDVITPMKRIMEGGNALVAYAFEPLRFDARGEPRPGFPVDDPAYAGARILVVGANFGCGSSRETAVWALVGLGYRCVIGTSFGDIFFSNCFKNGVLPLRLGEVEVAEIAAAARRREEIRVSLEEQSVCLEDGRRFAFEIAPIRKEAMLHGLDDLGLVLRRLDRIEAFEARDLEARPWVYVADGDPLRG
jgi:3-isopropylmalate/(R)-2-methylmalate dehydratase small subunit